MHRRFCFCSISTLPACRRLLFPLLHAEKGRLRNAVPNRVPASCWVPKILGTRCDRLTHSGQFQPNDIFFNTLHLLHSIRNSVFPPFFSFFLSQVINLYLYQFVLFPRLFSF